MKIIFMGSPTFAVPTLEALAASRHEVAAVVTQPDRPSGRKLILHPPAVKVVAHRLNLPVFQPQTTKTDEFVQEMLSFRPDLFVVAAYGEILRPKLLEVPAYGAINLHASLLPKYRGAAPVAWAILQGESETGVTTIRMNEGMDAGNILLAGSCPILPFDTAESLTRKLASIGAPLVVRTVDLLEQKTIVEHPQDPALVTYAPKLKKEDGMVNWTKPALWIARQIRAFDPWPGTYSYLDQLPVKFWLAHADQTGSEQQPGTVVRTTRHALSVACGNGSVLNVTEVQPHSKPRMAAADFINGYHISTGMRFSMSLNS